MKHKKKSKMKRAGGKKVKMMKAGGVPIISGPK